MLSAPDAAAVGVDVSTIEHVADREPSAAWVTPVELLAEHRELALCST